MRLLWPLLSCCCKLSYILTQAGVCNYLFVFHFHLLRTKAKAIIFVILCANICSWSHVTLNLPEKKIHLYHSRVPLIWLFSLFMEKEGGKQIRSPIVFFSRYVCLFIHLICNSLKTNIYFMSNARMNRALNYQLLQWIQHFIQQNINQLGIWVYAYVCILSFLLCSTVKMFG